MDTLLLYLRLFYEFCRTGLFAVGGGLATLPFLQEMGEKTGWFTTTELADMVAVSESTPGPLGVNMATYVGYTVGGVVGSVVATLGLVFPSVVIVLIVARILSSFKNSPIIAGIFYGLRPASVALITAAGLSVARIALLDTDAFAVTGKILSLFNWKCILLAAIIFVCYHKWKLHPIVYILISAVVGVVFSL